MRLGNVTESFKRFLVTQNSSQERRLLVGGRNRRSSTTTVVGACFPVSIRNEQGMKEVTEYDGYRFQPLRNPAYQ